MSPEQYKSLVVGDVVRVNSGWRANEVGRVTAVKRPYHLKVWFGLGDSYEFSYPDVDLTGQTRLDLYLAPAVEGPIIRPKARSRGAKQI